MNGLRPSTLQPGDRVRCGGRTYVFKCRYADMGVNMFVCSEYVGLESPDDDGRCVLTDARLVRDFERIEARGPQ